MELRNYANECYMKVRRNDLQSDIEKGYITQEQANQISGLNMLMN